MARACFFLKFLPCQKKIIIPLTTMSRFNLLQLDFGEEYIDDIASFHCPAMPSQWYPLPRVSACSKLHHIDDVVKNLSHCMAGSRTFAGVQLQCRFRTRIDGYSFVKVSFPMDHVYRTISSARMGSRRSSCRYNLQSGEQEFNAH